MKLVDLKGIGKITAEKLALFGINSVIDLLFHLPLRYQDKTKITPMQDLLFAQSAVVQGEIVKTYTIPSRKPMLVCEISDDSGTVSLKFFNYFHSQKIKFSNGQNIQAYGEVRFSKNGVEMMHPEYQHFDKTAPPLSTSLTAIYPKSDGIQQKLLQKSIAQVLTLLDEGKLQLEEFLPQEILSKHKFPDLKTSLLYVHKPPSDANTQALLSGTHICQQRLILEEIMAHLLAMKKLRQQVDQLVAPKLMASKPLIKQFLSKLPFSLTGAQKRVTREIYIDLKKNKPMQRLVQGDVGSGKTVIAALAALAAKDTKYQIALMAPTEILAEQHFKTLNEWFKFEDLVFLSSAIKGKKRKETLERIQSGTPIIIGTHALFQNDVEFGNLGLVIIDEQHRFGVHQRLELRNKGQENNFQPHMLIMTATPIPRTLAQTAYANLDISVIDELPPNRQEIGTLVVSNTKMQQVAERIKESCSQGEQAYWVCTLIEESEMLRSKAATDTAEELQILFPKLRIGLVHGRMKSTEKNQIMNQFKAHEIDLLVATTVIEVGVDVPNASLMVIENSERLGLSQLHQLRGRVGRGNKKSHCVLMYQAPLGEIAKQRLEIMRNTTDGFEIAREDLKIRGAGEILGTKQKGAVQFRLADMERDQHLFDIAHSLSSHFIKTHPQICELIIQRWIGDTKEISNV